jgi:hypothetical protein
MRIVNFYLLYLSFSKMTRGSCFKKISDIVNEPDGSFFDLADKCAGIAEAGIYCQITLHNGIPALQTLRNPVVFPSLLPEQREGLSCFEFITQIYSIFSLALQMPNSLPLVANEG